MTLGDLVKEYREKQNISMEEFSKMCNLSKGYISMLENNINPRNNKPIAPTLPTIRKIAVAMNEEVDSILKAMDSSQEIILDALDEASIEIKPKIMEKETAITNYDDITSNEYEHIKKYRALDSFGQETVTYILDRETARVHQLKNNTTNIIAFEPQSNIVPARIISYYYKNASAGTGQLIIDNLPEKDIEIPDIPEYKNVSYAIGVNGSSMEPAFYDGDILLIEATRELQIGDIGIFQISNECYVKKLGENELISLNPEATNIPLNESAGIMGKVIGKLNNKIL